MTTVVVSVPRVVDNLEVGGHFWVFMQYVDGLQRLGCEVWWMEQVSTTGHAGDPGGEHAKQRIARFLHRMSQFGLGDRIILYAARGTHSDEEPSWDLLTVAPETARNLIRRAELFLNFDYRVHPSIPASFARSALVDIDPGLLQFWMYHGQIPMVPHDVYLTTGETVGTPQAPFPDCGQRWLHINPGVSLELWPFAPDPAATTFTTVSSWWGDEWITDGVGHYENNKRVSFLEYIDLPSRSGRALELALCLGPGDSEDVSRLLAAGWRIEHSSEVAGTLDAYRAFVYRSRGEFSCAKPSCMKFQNAWISDRTLCYLASGRPVVVQHTGDSRRLPSGEGLFRFSSLDEAAEALVAVDADYERHCRAARDLAEATFDARVTAATILNEALGNASPVTPPCTNVRRMDDQPQR